MAWRTLTVIVIFCTSLMLASILLRFGRPVDASNLAEAIIHLLRPAFVLSVAWLSLGTARDAGRAALLEEAAYTDLLTGLGNRRRFTEELEKEVLRADGLQSALSVVVMDLDHFKQVNDDFGHAGGDRALQHVASRLLNISRATDIPCRIGGEELAIIMPGVARDQATRIAERLRTAIGDAPLQVSCDCNTRITASAGVVSLRPGEDPHALLAQADGALYEAKRSGRDRLNAAA